MNAYHCPHCKQRMYSAYDKRGQKVVECIYCNREFENQYYRRDEDGTHTGAMEG